MPTNDVDTAVQTVRHHLDSGLFKPVTSNDVKAAVDALKGLNSADSSAALAQLSDAELSHLAAEINDGSWFGLGGTSQGAKTDFFNEMARDLDGEQLERLAQAFDRTTGPQTAGDRLGAVDDIALLARAVATHASDATKVDFIRRLAGSSTDQLRVRTMNEDRVYDPQARAIAEVLGGLQHNPAAAELAFESLRPEQVREVLNAATREVQHFAFAFGGGSSVTLADASTFDAVMTAASRIGDADTKARIFDEGVAELKDLESRGLHEAAEVARNGLTRLLMSDTNGVMRELAYNKETFDGSVLAYYAKSMLNAGEAARLGEIQAQILTGNQRDTADPVARFEEVSSTASGQDRYFNAEVAGYFAGAVTSAARSITDDARQQAELLTAVFKSALTVIDKSNVGRSLGAGPGVAKEWVQFPVRAAMDALIAGRVDAADAMVLSMQPTRDVEKLPNGTVDIEIGIGSAARSAFQSTWSMVLQTARPDAVK